MLYCNKEHQSQQRIIKDTKQNYIILGANKRTPTLRTWELRIHSPKQVLIKKGQHNNLYIGMTRSGNSKLTTDKQDKDYLLIDTNVDHVFVDTIYYDYDDKEDIRTQTFPAINGHVSIFPLDSGDLTTLPRIMQRGSIPTETGVHESYLIEYKKNFVYEINYSPNYITYIVDSNEPGIAGTAPIIREYTFTQLVSMNEDGILSPKLATWVEQRLQANLRLVAKVGKL